MKIKNVVDNQLLIISKLLNYFLSINILALLKGLTWSLVVLLFSFKVEAQQTVGLFQNDSTSFNGYTLFTPLGNTNTYLIDNCGEVVNQWTSSYTPGNSVYLLPNGNLLRTGKGGSSIFNTNGGVIELKDWNDNLIWTGLVASNNFHQHHDIEPLPNGNILVLGWEYHPMADAISMGRDPNFIQNAIWSEQIWEIEPFGTNSYNVVWEWHMKDHLIQEFDASKMNYGTVAQHPEKINFNYPAGLPNTPSKEDWIHANSIAYSPVLDQIIISSRHLNEIWVIDHSTTTAEAATSTGGNSGKGGDILYRWGNPAAYNQGTSTDKTLFGQHTAYWIPQGLPNAGKIMVFNNGFDGRGYSSVDIIDPPVDAQGNYTLSASGTFLPDSVQVAYQATIPTDFYANFVSSGQQLPNGNTLIGDGAAGRIFEVNPMGEVVWDYINPVRNSGPVQQGTNISGNNIFRAFKYASDYSGLQGVDLTPSNPIEVNPLPSNCIIYTSTDKNVLIDLKIYPNPVIQSLYIEHDIKRSLSIQIYNIHGQLVWNKSIQQNITNISTQDWSKGLYLVKVIDANHTQTFKIIKL